MDVACAKRFYWELRSTLRGPNRWQRMQAWLWRRRVALLRTLSRDPATMQPVHPRADLIRIGSEYGGWVIPSALLSSASICYCVGVGEDITFDLGLIERFGCDVWSFDPTPRAIAHVERTATGVAEYHFSPIGLWDRRETLRFYAPANAEHVSHSALNLDRTSEFFEAQCERLSALMQTNGHTRIDLLKLDIEGAEYRVIESLLADKLDIRVLCVEFDEAFRPLDWRYLGRVRRTLRALRRYGFEIVDADRYCNYTLVHKSASDT